MSSLYVLVSFPGDGDSMSIVPSSWLQGDESYWPPYKQQDKVDKAVKCLEKPKKEWNLHKVRILGMYDSYSKARVRLTKAMVTSELSTTEDENNPKPRKRSAPLRYEGESSDDSDAEVLSTKKTVSKCSKQLHKFPAAPVTPRLPLKEMQMPIPYRKKLLGHDVQETALPSTTATDSSPASSNSAILNQDVDRRITQQTPMSRTAQITTDVFMSTNNDMYISATQQTPESRSEWDTAQITTDSFISLNNDVDRGITQQTPNSRSVLDTSGVVVDVAETVASFNPVTTPVTGRCVLSGADGSIARDRIEQIHGPRSDILSAGRIAENPTGQNRVTPKTMIGHECSATESIRIERASLPRSLLNSVASTPHNNVDSASDSNAQSTSDNERRQRIFTTDEMDLTSGALSNTVTMNKAHKIMITLLLELKSDMRDLRSQLSDITGLLNHQPSSTLTGGSSTLNFMLPLKTKDELKNFEERLAKDNTLRQNVTDAIAKRGGSCTKKVVTKALSFLFTNKLMDLLNWTGMCGKTAYGKLQCREIVQEAVRRNRRTADATDEEIEIEVKKYLHGAGDRDGGKAKRATAARNRHQMSRQAQSPDDPDQEAA